MKFISQKLDKYFNKFSFGTTIKTAIFSSPLAIIRLICGFTKAKLIAIFLGAKGVGLLSQANQFLLLFVSIGSLGMVNGLMQQLSYNREIKNVQKQLDVKGTVFVSQLFTVGLIIFALLPFLSNIAIFLFGEDSKSFRYGVFCIIVSIPISVISTNYIEGFFTAYHKFDLYVKAASVTTIISVILLIPAIYFWGIFGAISNLLVNAVLLFVFYIYYVIKIEKLKNIFTFKFRFTEFQYLFKDGFINLFCGALLILVNLFIRNLIIQKYGGAQNGVYQLCLSITAYYSPFLINPLWAKYFPIISARGLCKETREIIFSTLQFTILATSAIVFILLGAPEILIHILSTSEFLQAKYYLPIQLFGDVWYFIFFTYTLYLLATRNTIKYLWSWIFFLVSQYLISKFMIEIWGIRGAAVGYCLSAILGGLLSLILFTKMLGGIVIMNNIFVQLLLMSVCIILQSLLIYYDIDLMLRLLFLIFIGLLSFNYLKKFNKEN